MKRWGIVVLLFLTASITVAAQPNGASGAIVAIEEPSGRAGGSGAVKESGTVKAGAGQSTKASSTTKTVSTKKPTKVVVNHPAPPPPPPTAKYSGDVIGDKYTFLNFEVIDRVQPTWTNAAKNAGAKGLVQVEILVERDGRVLAARARTGNQLLWPEAERAALASRLNSPTFNNRPVRAMGFLVYRFGPGEDDD